MVNDPRVPARMTGGVDLTGSVDMDDPEKVADYIARLNASPDVIQTISGGTDALGISIGDLADHDGSKGFREDKEHAEALAEVRSAYDGSPVRVIPPSRFRTQRFYLSAGATAVVADRDSRRRNLGIWIIDPANGIQTAYVGSDLASVIANGVQIMTGTGAPYSLVLTHADIVVIGAASTNTGNIIVNAAYEIAE